MSMVVYWLYRRKISRLYMTDFQTIRYIYDGVGFGIAYPRKMGNTRA